MNEIDLNQIIEIPSVGKCTIEQLKRLLLHLKTRYDTIKRYRDIVDEFRSEKIHVADPIPDEAIYDIYEAIERESRCEQSMARDMMLKDIRIFFSNIQQ